MTITGFGMMVQMASTNTVIQTIVDEEKRGRVMSFYTMSFLGTAPFGSLLAGWLSTRIGAPQTVIVERRAVHRDSRMVRARAARHPRAGAADLHAAWASCPKSRRDCRRQSMRRRNEEQKRERRANNEKAKNEKSTRDSRDYFRSSLCRCSFLAAQRSASSCPQVAALRTASASARPGE